MVGTYPGGATTVVQDGVEGLIVPPRDPQRLADAMIRVATDRELNMRMGDAAYTKGAVRNTWQDYGDRLLEKVSTGPWRQKAARSQCMNPWGVLKRYWLDLQRARAQGQILASRVSPTSLDRRDWDRSLADPTAFYFDCFRYFHQQLPQELAEHRRYFSRKKRGFGEDAFHTMWFLLFREFKPGSFLEIGVYRGQTLSLAALLARREQISCYACGISPFASVGDSVSRYVEITNYREDTLRNFEAFKLPPPELVTELFDRPQSRGRDPIAPMGYRLH